MNGGTGCCGGFAWPWALWLDEWRMFGGAPTLRHRSLVAAPVRTLPALHAALHEQGLADVRDLPLNHSVHLFVTGVAPAYDDPYNRRGGHLSAYIGRYEAAELWWRLVLATAALPVDQPGPLGGPNVVGISLLHKPEYFVVQLWLTASPTEEVHRLRGALAALLELSAAHVKFAAHRSVLRTLRRQQRAAPAAPRASAPEAPDAPDAPASPGTAAADRAAAFLARHLHLHLPCPDAPQRPLCRIILPSSSPLRPYFPAHAAAEPVAGLTLNA